jgi:hypothetical protein
VKRTLLVATPQFERLRGAIVPSAPPANQQSWKDLKNYSLTALKERGCGVWGLFRRIANQWHQEDHAFLATHQLLLLPGEWIDHIPRGFELITISGKLVRFNPSQTSRDIRAGYLSYGIMIVKE